MSSIWMLQIVEQNWVENITKVLSNFLTTQIRVHLHSRFSRNTRRNAATTASHSNRSANHRSTRLNLADYVVNTLKDDDFHRSCLWYQSFLIQTDMIESVKLNSACVTQEFSYSRYLSDSFNVVRRTMNDWEIILRNLDHMHECEWALDDFFE